MKQVINQYKTIYDNIHGYIGMSNIAVNIIDNQIFQRLRKLKQLGLCSQIYQNATHTRFEHSIGTYHLAGKIMNNIVSVIPRYQMESYMKNIKELGSYYKEAYGSKIYIIDEYVIELVKIAALCHDLGHGPFSHVFDDAFLPNTQVSAHPNAIHEHRSGVLLEQIIKSSDFLRSIISNDSIQFIKNLINPDYSIHKGFIYQIVSNGANGLDVDKYDYLTRDTYVLGFGSKFKYQRLIEHIRIIDDNICYPEQVIGDIIELYNARYTLHKTIYGHKGVISVQFMLIDLLKALDPLIGISSTIDEPSLEKFCKLTDDYILTVINTLDNPLCIIPENLKPQLAEARYLIDRINSHKLYSHVQTFVSVNKLPVSIDNFPESETYKKNQIIVFRNKIGFVSGHKSNPLNNVYVYNTKNLIRGEDLIASLADINKYSLLITQTYQEYIYMVFYKEKHHSEITNIRTEFDKIIKIITNPEDKEDN